MGFSKTDIDYVYHEVAKRCCMICGRELFDDKIVGQGGENWSAYQIKQDDRWPDETIRNLIIICDDKHSNCLERFRKNKANYYANIDNVNDSLVNMELLDN